MQFISLTREVVMEFNFQVSNTLFYSERIFFFFERAFTMMKSIRSIFEVQFESQLSKCSLNELNVGLDIFLIEFLHAKVKLITNAIFKTLKLEIRSFHRFKKQSENSYLISSKAT